MFEVDKLKPQKVNKPLKNQPKDSFGMYTYIAKLAYKAFL